jgi:predicted nuclease with TOPRIM domain
LLHASLDVFYVFYGILQAEWEEVANRADLLKQENSSLKEELKQLQEKCDGLTSENTSLHVSSFLLLTSENISLHVRRIGAERKEGEC